MLIILILLLVSCKEDISYIQNERKYNNEEIIAETNGENVTSDSIDFSSVNDVNSDGKVNKEGDVTEIEDAKTFDVEIVYKEYVYNTEVKAIWSNITININTRRKFSDFYHYADGTMQMFNKFDSNSDGKLELSEAQEMPFSLIDGNCDSLVYYDEFTQYLDDLGEAGIIIPIQPDNYKVTCNHEYLNSSYKENEDLPFGLNILGIKTSNIDGCIYEPNTVAVCWDFYYDLLNGNEIVCTIQPSATFLPSSMESSNITFKSSISLSEFEDLVKKGNEIYVNDKVYNSQSDGLLTEYTLTIRPHQ